MMSGVAMNIVVMTTTVGSEADAARLASDLVARRLAACVQVDAGVRSFYRWQGRDCEDLEWRLTLKTVPERADAVAAFLSEHHPYELPQVVMVPARASADYAAWVRSEVGEG